MNDRLRKRLIMLRAYLKRPDFVGVMLSRQEIEDVVRLCDEADARAREWAERAVRAAVCDP